MRIPLYHLHGLVAGDGRDLHNAKSLLSEPGRGLVAQVVEGQALDARGLADPLKGLRDRIRAKGPDRTVGITDS